ncbi:MAG: Maf family protein [Caloramator sp.]|nr:Maf family protein [Caloramator sp.]
MKKIVLASSSPRRIELLKKFNINFEVIPSNFEEKVYETNPVTFAMDMAKGKALEVAKGLDKDYVVISADTIVTKDNKIFGKPKNEEDAVRMLKELSGSTHDVITAICVYDLKKEILKCEVEKTEVAFKELTEQEILDYINTKEPFDKAGAYAIQGIGCLFVKSINGCFFNVVGLPIFRLSQLLREVGVNLLKGSVSVE